MAKQKERSETEFLRGKIKKLEAENKALKRRNKKLEKTSHQYESLQEDLEDEGFQETVSELNKNCHTCGKGRIEKVHLGIRVMMKCSNCDWFEIQKTGSFHGKENKKET